MVVVSNRGPLSFRFDDGGEPVAAGSGGGLAAALRSMLPGTEAAWVSCAMSDADAAAYDQGLMRSDDLDLHLVRPSADVYRMAYGVVSNAILWFVHHHLFDTTHRPRFDRRWEEAWEAYRDLNDMFCDKVAEVAGHGASVMVHDYHLALLPAGLRKRRPDLRTVHFTHTPFADPGVLRILPAEVAEALLHGMAAAGGCGFHAPRWERGFLNCCADNGVATPRTFVSPLAVDAGQLEAHASDPDVRAARHRLDDIVGDRAAIVRVDRLEPTKNMLRGFWAYDQLLEERPDLRGKVVMLAFAYLSRQTLPEYLAYADEVRNVTEQLNERWGGGDWEPVVLEVADDPPRSVAALTRYDVLLVNPVRDGLNLVAKEGPVLNTRDGMLVLSREAGATYELSGPALEINPFDITATAQALGRALDMSTEEKSRRAGQLRSIISGRTPRQWLDDLLDNCS